MSPRRVIAGPALALAGWILFPSVADPQVEWVDDIAAEPTRAAAGMAAGMVGMALSILAYMALAHLLRERRPFAGDLGGPFAIVGAALTAALMG